MSKKQFSPVESIKIKSRGLRGTIEESLNNPVTGAISDDDQAVIKFHGMYQQDDRDRREERAKKKLERAYSFMIRLRLPGGFLTAKQWLATHHIAGAHATGVIKITTRQTVQLHGILKNHIKPTIQSFDAAKLDSIATCGDINRNVACASHPGQSPVHAQIHGYAEKISRLLMPKTKAYYEIWLGAEKIAEKTEDDPLYKETYLPRKFKIGIGIPPNNEVDVLTNDIGLIAIIEDGALRGFNIAVGGGLSTTHGNPNTYARLGSVIGFTEGEENTLKAVYEILTIQRDFGDRTDRKQARLKYTLDRMGVDTFRKELENRIGFPLQKSKEYTFTEREDYYGWSQNKAGLWYYTVFVENGRVLDTDELKLKTALYEVAETGKADFRFTSNQNVILADIKPEDKDKIQAILHRYKIDLHTDESSNLRKNALACVALNTCPLALAEGQRYLPTLIGKIEPLLNKYDLEQDKITIRMTGCPNGCARPYAAEIGLIGISYGHYNLHIGGDRQGTRLNEKYRESMNEEAILNELDHLFKTYSTERQGGETFGDFCERFLQ